MRTSLKEQTITQIRAFNRYYMPQLDLLNRSYLESAYSVTEARILFELVENQVGFAQELMARLHIDKGYLSRILKKFEIEGLLTKQISPKDKRFYQLVPTAKARALVKDLVLKSNQQIACLITHFNAAECKQLMQAMQCIQTLFSAKLSR